jgi:hypothetical protein
MHLLEKERDRRYQTADGPLHDLERVRGYRTGGLAPARKALARHSAVSGAGVRVRAHVQDDVLALSIRDDGRGGRTPRAARG